jgi:hypothetical protein
MSFFVEQPEDTELPTQLSAQLFQHPRQSILDGVRLGEGTADGVLND